MAEIFLAITIGIPPEPFYIKCRERETRIVEKDFAKDANLLTKTLNEGETPDMKMSGVYEDGDYLSREDGDYLSPSLTTMVKG